MVDVHTHQWYCYTPQVDFDVHIKCRECGEVSSISIYDIQAAEGATFEECAMNALGATYELYDGDPKEYWNSQPLPEWVKNL